MRKIVLDTNLLLSALRSRNTAFREKIFSFDTPFVALCLQLNAPLWSKDEKLKTGLRNKGFNDFFEG
jgi:predicted nucleic acid-binding protein